MAKMAKIVNDDLSYLGDDYQIRLVRQLIYDRQFANNILDTLEANHFSDEYIRVIVATIKESRKQYDTIPDIGTLTMRLVNNASKWENDYFSKTLEKIKNADLNDGPYIQDMAMSFCKFQNYKKATKDMVKIIDTGDIERFPECEEILRKAQEATATKDDGFDVFTNIESVLADDFREPIRTGILELDKIMGGGLAKTELALILAPFGVGKTTMITKLANTAYNDGKKVLQIFFEDNTKVIQRKHVACWTKIDLNSLAENKEQIILALKEKQTTNTNGGELKLKKFPSDGTTIPIIRRYIRKLIGEGFKPDIVLLDYIDCVQASTKFDDANIAEGSVMRQFETMLSELDIAGWTATQGNRSSISASVVEASQMAGSIKKGMIGHFIVSIAKTLDQKDEGTATMAILKSRFGKDGYVYENIRFDNASIQIDMGECVRGKKRTEYKIDKDKENQNIVATLLDQNKAKKIREITLGTNTNEITNTGTTQTN